MSPEQEQQLIDAAIKVKEFSYSPYSHFRVGSALLTKDGQIFSGCNVENASYAGAICAERTAFVKAVSEGHKEFDTVAVTSDQPFYVYPCGFCRQFMVEFGKDINVLLITSKKETKRLLLSELLPHSFGPEDLRKDSQ